VKRNSLGERVTFQTLCDALRGRDLDERNAEGFATCDALRVK
jgi:hypothetical protein